MKINQRKSTNFICQFKKIETFRLILLAFMLTFGFVFASDAYGKTVAANLETQQNNTKVQGVVKDNNGEALIGVSIVIKGTNVGTITDANGKFSLNIESTNSILVFSYVGYKNQNLTANKNVLNVIMEEDSKSMQEIVVVGYGTQKKENLSGAVSTVDINKSLSSRPIADVGRGLQGSVPGLTVIVGNGEVGSDAVMKIRGQIGSLYGGSAPLILLDNVEIPSIQLVNPSDIESISVLKDAASTSIYGSRGAFGVILITSKKGTSTESMNVQYSTNYSWQNAAKAMNMGTIDALEYSVLAAERASATKAGAFWQVDRASYEKSKLWLQNYGSTVKPGDPMLYGRDWYYDVPNTSKMGVRMYDPYDYMIREWAPSKNHNMTVSGKSGKTSYNIGLDYLNQSGMMKPAKKDEFTKYNASVKISTEVNKYLTLHAGLLFSNRSKEYAYVTTGADPWLYLYRWSSLQPLTTEGGDQLRGAAGEATAANTAKQEWNYNNVNVGATLNITKNWNVEADFTFSNQEFTWLRPGTRFTLRDAWSAPIKDVDAAGNQLYVNEAGQYVGSTETGAMAAYRLAKTTYTGIGSAPDHIYRSAENTKQRTTNIYSTYNLKFGGGNEHAMKFMAGMNMVSYDMVYSWAQKASLMVYDNPQFDLATGTQTSGGDAGWSSQIGFFGRVNYAYMDKYLFEANIRRDAANKFPTHLMWRWFPSFSAGWRVTEEEFMKPLNPYISTLKLRGSWGTIGDQTIPSSLYKARLGSYTGTWLNGEVKYNAFTNPPLVQPDIMWQDINTLDIGLDMRLLKDKIGISFDWFKRTNQNMLVAGAAAPITLGSGSPVGNFGELTTTGWELAVDFNHRFRGGLGLSVMASLSDATTVVTKYQQGALKTVSNAFFEGKRYGDIYGYTTDRLYQMDDFELDGAGKLQLITLTAAETTVAGNVGKKAYKLKTIDGVKPIYQVYLQNASNFYFGPGDVKFADLNNDAEINNGSNIIDNMGDLSVIGNSTPRFQYSFRLSADYKGIDATVLLQGVGEMNIWGDGSLAIAGYHSSDGGMPQTIAGDFWKEDRIDAFYPRPFNNAGSGITNNMQIQSRYLLDMSYLRVKNMTLGYTLPAAITKNILISKARFYVSLENFFTFDNLRGLPLDPEAIAGQNPGMSGSADGSYNLGRVGLGTPMFKSFSVGTQISF
jgi:TonB-linked SusC/RagA family outer membrane protein